MLIPQTTENDLKLFHPLSISCNLSISGHTCYNSMIKLCRLVTSKEYREFRDFVILLESSFAQVTRKGTGIKQVHLGITPDYLIIASYHAADISIDSPSSVQNKNDYLADCLELESIIPLELLNISVHSNNHFRLRIRLCNGAVRYYELSEFNQPEAKWRSWCDRLDFLNSDLTSSSSISQCSLNDVTMTNQNERWVPITTKEGKGSNNCVCLEPKRRAKKAGIRQQRKVQGLLDDNEDECTDQVGVAISPELLEKLLGQQSTSDDCDTRKSQMGTKYTEARANRTQTRTQQLQHTISRFASGVAERCENRLTLGEFTLPHGYNASGAESGGDQLPFGRVSPSPFSGISSNPLCALSPFQSLDNVLRRLDPDWYKPTYLPANKWCGADVAKTGKRRLKTPLEMAPCLPNDDGACAENQQLQHAADGVTRFSCGSEQINRPGITKAPLSQNIASTFNSSTNLPSKQQDRLLETEKLRNFWSSCNDQTDLPFARTVENRRNPALICDRTKLPSRRPKAYQQFGRCRLTEDLLGSHLHLASERHLFGRKRSDVGAIKQPYMGKEQNLPSKVIQNKSVDTPLYQESTRKQQAVIPGFVPTCRSGIRKTKVSVDSIPSPIIQSQVPKDFIRLCENDPILSTSLTPIAKRLPRMVGQLPPCPLAKLILSPPIKPKIWRKKYDPTDGKPKKLKESSADPGVASYNEEWLTGRAKCLKSCKVIPPSPSCEYLTQEFIDLADRCVVMWEMALHTKMLSKPELVMPYANTLCFLLELQRNSPLCRIRRVRSDPCLMHELDQSHGTDILPISKEKLLRTFSVSAFNVRTKRKELCEGTHKNVFPASYEMVRKSKMAFWFLPLPLALSQDDFDPSEQQCVVKRRHRKAVRAYLECLESHCYPPTEEDLLKICTIQKCLLLPAANPLCDGQSYGAEARCDVQGGAKKGLAAKVKGIIAVQRKKWRLRRHHPSLSSNLNVAPPKLYPDTFDIHKLNSRLLEFRSRELACELTLIDKELFCRVPDREIETLGCGRLAGTVNYVHLKTLIAWYDRIVNLFTSEILAYNSPETRAQAVIKCLKIIQYMTEVRSYHSARAILCALQSIPIYRLRKTWWIMCEQYPIYFKKFCSMSAFYVDVQSCALMSQPGRRPPYVPFYGEVFCIMLGDLGDIDVHYESESPAVWVDHLSNTNVSSSAVQIKTIIRKKWNKRTACLAEPDVHVNFHNLAAIGRVKQRPMDIDSRMGRRRLSKIAVPPSNCLDVFHHFQEAAYFYSIPSNFETRNYLMKQPFCPPQISYTMSRQKEAAKEVYPVIRQYSGIF